MTQINNKNEYPILIVDDEYNIIEALNYYLFDYYTDYATDTETALQKLKEGNFKIVLADILMPGRNGFELLREIKKMDSDIEVIMMTGQTLLIKPNDFIETDETILLYKPFDDIALVDEAISNAMTKIVAKK